MLESSVARFPIVSHRFSIVSADYLMPVHQVQQREQEDPDDVHEVPVQAGDLDRRVPARARTCRAPPSSSITAMSPEPDDHVQRVQAGHREVEREEQVRACRRRRPRSGSRGRGRGAPRTCACTRSPLMPRKTAPSTIVSTRKISSVRRLSVAAACTASAIVSELVMSTSGVDGAERDVERAARRARTSRGTRRGRACRRRTGRRRTGPRWPGRATCPSVAASCCCPRSSKWCLRAGSCAVAVVSSCTAAPWARAQRTRALPGLVGVGRLGDDRRLVEVVRRRRRRRLPLEARRAPRVVAARSRRTAATRAGRSAGSGSRRPGSTRRPSTAR